MNSIINSPKGFEHKAYIDQAKSGRRAESGEKSVAEVPRAPQEDIVVSLSGGSQDLQVAKSATAETQARLQEEDKAEAPRDLDALKRAIQDGSYAVDPEKIAGKIIADLA
jgi:anti-sigma28 factor (negative regulator of flagellin synthesis)